MKRIVFIISMVLACQISYSQIVTRYLSPKNEVGDNSLDKELVGKNILELPSMNIKELLREDSLMRDDDMPFRFGVGVDTVLTLKDGEWDLVENGRIWSKTIRSKNAYSINVVFDKLYLPKGATLEIINEDKSVIYGPVTHENNTKDGFFMTDIIPGKQITINLFEPLESVDNTELRIKRIVQGYRSLDLNSIIGSKGVSSPDNIDVACHPEYEKESKAVGLILLSSGFELCSGALIMTTDMSFKAYFLTAFHCIDSYHDELLTDAEIQNAQQWMFKFNYKKEACNGTTLSQSYTYNGATFKAAWPDTDFGLMEINGTLRENHELSWLGWNHSGNNPSSASLIHHPKGDVMKISIDDDPQTSTTWGGDNIYDHWRSVFDEGVCQPGSSGAPLIDSSHRVIGQLHGGDDLNQSINAKSGKFHLSWTGGGTNNTRLSNWLDSIGTNQLTMDGYTPVSVMTIYGPTIPQAASVYYVSPLFISNCTITWSWKNTQTMVPITQNSPSVNQCTINNSSKEYIVDTLVAVVSKNGNTIATIEKAIDTGAGFYGTYEQEGADYVSTYVPECPPTSFHSGDRFTLYKGPTITLWSPKFVGATFSFAGNESPSNWTHNGNTISFKFRYLPPAPLQSQGETGMTRPLNVGMIVTGRYSNSYETFRFTIMPMLPMLVNPPSFLISSSGNIYTFTPSALNDETSMISSNGSWNLIITNTLTGRVMYTGSIRGASHTIDTSSWEEGVYAVQARVGETVLTQKFTVSK